MKNKRIRVLAVAMAAIMAVSVAPMRTYAAGNTQQDMSLQGERIYQIMTDRFYDGDLSNNAAGGCIAIPRSNCGRYALHERWRLAGHY